MRGVNSPLPKGWLELPIAEVADVSLGKTPKKSHYQYLCQLRKAEGGLRGMNTAQAGDLVENLGE